MKWEARDGGGIGTDVDCSAMVNALHFFRLVMCVICDGKSVLSTGKCLFGGCVWYVMCM